MINRKLNRIYIYRSYQKQESLTKKQKRISKSINNKRNIFNLGKDIDNDISIILNQTKPNLIEINQINCDNSINNEEIQQKNNQLQDNFIKKKQFIKKYSNILKRRNSCHCEQCGQNKKLQNSQYYFNMKDLVLLLKKSRQSFDKEFIQLKVKQNQLVQQKLINNSKISMTQSKISVKEIKDITIIKNSQDSSLNSSRKIYIQRQNQIAQLYSEQNLQQLTKKINQIDEEPEFGDLNFDYKQVAQSCRNLKYKSQQNTRQNTQESQKSRKNNYKSLKNQISSLNINKNVIKLPKI